MRPPESFISQPIRSLQTMLRVISESSNQIPTVVPDGIYGQTTMRAITEFQRNFGLPLTGITDQRTWDAIVQEYEDAIVRIGPAEPIQITINPGQVFTVGDDGPVIYLTQSMLIWLARDYGSITPPDHTGIFDTPTKDAIFAFQNLAGLEATGELDRITWKHLSRHFTLNAHHRSDRKTLGNF